MTTQNIRWLYLHVFQVAGIRVKLNQFRDEMEQFVVNQEFSKAAELKQQIIELEEQKELLDSQEYSFSQTVRSEEKVIYISMCAILKARKKNWKIQGWENFNLSFLQMLGNKNEHNKEWGVLGSHITQATHAWTEHLLTEKRNGASICRQHCLFLRLFRWWPEKRFIKCTCNFLMVRVLCAKNSGFNWYWIHFQ